ncbi:MAG: DUF1684 domain-containing protein [Anaerolineae bacterium]|nr:DUF1684 domain-containing protein [Anaerolineae bacterium]
MNAEIELLDYRRRVAEMYARLRNGAAGMETKWEQFKHARDQLFKEHAQSALSEQQRGDFRPLEYFPYDAKWRFAVKVNEAVERDVIEVPLQDDGLFRMQRFGRVEFEAGPQLVSLYVYWVLGYGGGLFLPFRDGTGKTGETYGGGRYLLDSIKGADLGIEDGKLVLDFNFAYNPSCAYHPRWHCPLPPQENWLDVKIEAGEKVYSGFES